MALNIQFTNNATSVLASGILVGGLSLTVSTGQGALFPALSGNQYFYCTLSDAATNSIREIVKVTARTGDTFTIIRAQEGTTAHAYSAGDKVELRPTAAGLVALSSETINSVITWQLKSTAYTAVAGDKIMADTSAASFNLTLPATPASGDTVQITDASGSFATHALTVVRNGSTIMGLAEDMTVSTANIGFGLAYTGTTWRIF